eukprot:6495990-Alexandrium_andersonii.AAC.1
MATPAWPLNEPPLLPFAYIHPRVQEVVMDGRPVQLFQQALMERWVEASRSHEAGAPRVLPPPA